MKRLALTTIAALACLWFTISCTHNNGDIGTWFGTWKVTQIDRNSEKLTSYEGNVFFLFQSTVFELRELEENHNMTETFGQWSENGDMLTISFPDTNYQPSYFMTIKGFTATNHFKIVSRSSTHVTLQIEAPNGTFTYYLKKWG